MTRKIRWVGFTVKAPVIRPTAAEGALQGKSPAGIAGLLVLLREERDSMISYVFLIDGR
jgi:hypothetical protein